MHSSRYKLLSFKLIVSLLVLTFLSGLSSKAQQDNFGWRVSVGYGYTNYYGDLSNYTISLKNAENAFKLFHLNTRDISVSNLSKSMLNSYSFSIEKKWTNTIGIMVQYSHNIIYGNDRTDLNENLNPSNLNFSRALNFKSNLDNVFLGLVLRTDNDHILRSTSFIAPYLILGAGYTFFNPKADLYDASGTPYNYSTDGTIAGGVSPDGVYETSLQPLITESNKYKTSTLNAGLGLGIRFRITSRFGIHAESALHYTFTDRLDDVSGNYPTIYQNPKQEYASNPTGVARTVRGTSASNDIFVYHSISLRFSFGATQKKLYHVPVFNPNTYLNQLEEPVAKTIDPVAFDLTTIQDSSEQHGMGLLAADKASVAKKKENITPVISRVYEIRIIKKDSTNSKTNITIGSGRIINISIENSDVIIKGDLIENELFPTQNADSIKFRMLGKNKISEINLIKDSTDKAISEEFLVKQNILDDQFDKKLKDTAWKNEIFQIKIDSLNNVDSSQIEVFTHRMLVPETNALDQSKIEIPQREQQEQTSKFISGLEINKPDGINNTNLGTISKENTIPYQKIDANTKKNQEQQEETRLLAMQIDMQNKVFNEKLMQLQQQRNSQIKTDQNTLAYQESLRRIQEVNTMRSTQPEMDSLLKKEFKKLSLQIQKYENERMIEPISEVSDTIKETENIILKDSIMRLQSELKKIKDQPVVVMTKIIEPPADTIEVVKPIDTELIPVVEVFFDLGSAEVRSDEETRIRDIAQFLNNYPESKVILTGMADAIGNPDRNLEISLQRAEYVKKLLVQKYSIDMKRIKVDSIGSSQSEGESAFDRKVKIKIVNSF